MTDIATVLANLRALGHRLEVEDDDLVLHPGPGAPPSPASLAEIRLHREDLRLALTPVYVDIETHSAVDLEKVGAWTYSEHPSTQVLCLAYAIGDGPVRVWASGYRNPELDEDPEPDEDPERDEGSYADYRVDTAPPTDLYRAISAGALVCAHNYSFDRSAWNALMPAFGAPEIPIGQWGCTSFRARLARLPASLENVAKALDLPQQKDAAGHRFMRSLIKRDLEAKPLTPAEWARLTNYARQDGEVLRAIDRMLPPMPDAWRPIFELDAAMNDAGMPIDLEAVKKLITVRNAENQRLAQEFKRLTDGELKSPKQVAKFRARLLELGVDLPNLKRETLETWADENPQRNDLAADLINNRLQSAHASDTKLDRMLATAASTGRVRGGFTLHGAHSGRWSSQGTQLQNLPKGKIDDPESMLKALLERADGITAGTVDATQDPGWSVSIKEAISGCLRGCFKAPDGWVFVSVDLGQIESRVLCWVSGQDDKIELYRRGEDIYVAEAEGLGSNDRDLGKLLVLSAGFGASGRVVYNRAPGFGITLTEDEANEFTARWRANNPAIIEFWHAFINQLHLCIELPPDRPPIAFRCFNIWRTPETLFVQLPSGRALKYHDPQLEIGEFGSLVLTVKLPKNKKLLPTSLWHGAATENVVQAIAADLLMEGMLRLHDDGVFIVACVHDETLALAPIEHAEAIKQHMIAIMREPPPWAPDLPLAADAFINVRFIKPPKSKHAPLPPSSAERWMMCPGSIAAERKAEPEPESPYATEGTNAHELFAHCLESGEEPFDDSDPYYLMAIQHALTIAREIIAGRKFKVETRLQPIPGMAKVWGTADVLIFDAYDRVVAVIDFKFGVGVPVEANSIQLQIYGLLAAQQYGCPADGIDLHVIQPRCPHPQGPHRVHRLSTAYMDTLLARLQEAVQATEDPAAPRMPGDWCRFCKARKTCPERRSLVTRQLSNLFQPGAPHHAFAR